MSRLSTISQAFYPNKPQRLVTFKEYTVRAEYYKVFTHVTDSFGPTIHWDFFHNEEKWFKLWDSLCLD